ncbi:MAG TPA: hypothetical protein PKO25_10285 [Spirochaetota bacterium]|nr:hypothetical protein [Spirochaetota bacterium]OPZ39202.1 MAG: hypothetical protein BWY96_00442 [Spirochaetes bacterium ADurb.BinA120]HNU92247.1 hypothetical protein [Spirochaetota bacterium]HPI13857.1 hypothetical protein [Spirochaetota bacterium]HPO45257.1 hypothetical protein [Spirochaetota bacterium]
MKKTVYILFPLFCAILLYSNKASASGDFGLGFVLGSPSGFTAKYFLNRENAIAGGIGDAAGHGLYLYADYLIHFRGILPAREVSFFLGGGGAFHNYHRDRSAKTWGGDKNEKQLEGRMPFGINYVFEPIPIEVFLEIVPALEIIPDVDFHLRAGIGARYYF